MPEIVKYVLFDGVHHQKLKPLTLTRPVADLRVGIFTIQEKWSLALNSSVAVRTKDYLRKKFNSHISSAEIGISASLFPSLDFIDALDSIEENTIIMKNGKILAISPLPEENDELDSNLNDYRIVQFTGKIQSVEKPMDIFILNALEIDRDLNFVQKENTHSNNYGSGNLFIGDDIYIEDGAIINGATLNSSDGPIFISKTAEIMEGSNLRGPLVIMENSVIKMGSKIYGPTTIGPSCKIGGELNNVVFQGFSNKAHDGFLGNSVVGYWCNFGADSNSSNLKNNYSEVKSWNYHTEQFDNTGTMYCGLIIGDHSKCGINTMFNTGTVVGSFVNIFGAGFPSKFIPSYSWGGGNTFETYKFEKAVELAKIVMKRRGVELDKTTIDIYKSFFK
jgi:UDP-N-acetylglucosamine diphosphorylase/glucosamine-1-phosphate N-acetyltransferase